MCLAPQRRAIFGHLTFKNWSAIVVFCAFWLENVLRATAPCHFSSVCWTATSAPAALARLLFETTQRFATSLTFRACVPSFYTCTFFLVTRHACWSSFCWLDISTLLFNSADLTSLLCFSTLHIVGSYTSKLPSISIVFLLLDKIWLASWAMKLTIPWYWLHRILFWMSNFFHNPYH